MYRVTYREWCYLRTSLTSPDTIVSRHASHGLDLDVLFKRMKSRKAVVALVQRQERKAPHWTNWRPLVPVTVHD